MEKDIVKDVVVKKLNFVEKFFIEEEKYQQLKKKMCKEDNYFNSEEMRILYKLR